MLDIEAVLRLLRSPWQIQWHEQAGSTNTLALQAARAGALERLVIGAETQTSGRGRLGRRWLDVPGHCLLFSILLRPAPDSRRELIGLAAAVAVAEAAEQFGADLRLRWPNDLFWQERKVCGTLTEGASGAVVTGIGINVTAAPAVQGLQAASISQAAGRRVAREELLAEILDRFDARYAEVSRGRADAIIAAARRRDDLAGRQVVVRCGREELNGRCLGIDESGHLVVVSDGQTVALTAGEIVQAREV